MAIDFPKQNFMNELSGTTIAVAERLNRQWIGIDQSVQAVKVTELRLEKLCGSFETIVAEVI